MAEVRSASVVETEEKVSGVVQLTLAVRDPQFTFAPGQSITLHFGETRRTYCIASAPQRPSGLQLCIRLGGGEGSEAIRALKPGDLLNFNGPVGELMLPAEPKPLVLIAGDTGIAPMRSIILHLGATGDHRAVSLLYEPEGGELYSADLIPLADSGKFAYQAGQIEDLIRKNLEVIKRSAVLAAGYQPFLVRVEEILRSAGVDPESARFESFGMLY